MQAQPLGHGAEPRNLSYLIPVFSRLEVTCENWRKMSLIEHLAAVLGLQDVVDGVVADGGQTDVHREREGASIQRPVVVCTQCACARQAAGVAAVTSPSERWSNRT